MPAFRDPARLLRLFVLVFGVLLLVGSSAFIIGETWEGAGPTLAEQAAAPKPAAHHSEGAQAFSESFRRLASPTPSPAPTATPKPKPTSTPQPAEPPASAPQQVESPSSPPAQPPAAPPPAAASGCPTGSMSGFGSALYNAINAERSAAGMGPLAVHGCVVYVAQLRSNDMANRGYFSHTSPDGTTAFLLLGQYGVPYGWAGENLARNNYPDGEAVGIAIRDLMASPSHRDNILNPNYTHLGVGVAVDGTGMKYFTMVFIGPA